MRWNATSTDGIAARVHDDPAAVFKTQRGTVLALGLTVITLAGALVALGAARHAAREEASWLRQRLVEKRALVQSLHDDLAKVAQATERVSQMANIAREQNLEVRRLAQIEEPHESAYTPDDLAVIDDLSSRHSEEGGRALSQLAFLEEQLGETTDSLSLMIALSKGVRPIPPPSKGEPEPALRLAVARVEPVARKVPVTTPSAPHVKSASLKAPAARPMPAEPMTPTLLPVAGEVTSGFGMRLSPWGRGRQLHTGVDIRAGTGTPVRTSAAGTVVFAGRDSGGYGSTVVIDHGQNVKTLYGHLSGIYVRTGQRLPRGTVVGAVGNTGRSTGAHLHFEVRVGNVPVDPMRYLKREGGVEQVASAKGYRDSR